MRCPVDAVELVMTERQGIEVDYCPTCRGVWLDRGELDKIIERSAAPVAAASVADAPGEYRPDRHDPRQGGYDPRYDKRRKKKGFLEDLFDF